MEHTIKKYRLDIIIIAALLTLSLSVLLIINLTRKDGATVTVTVDGVTVAEYPLAKDGVYTLNGGSNILTIENGTAHMSYSSCPDHICENKGKIKYVGQTIVCLPNKLTVTVTGEAEDDGVDFYS